MNAADLPVALRAWRQREGISQREAGRRFGVRPDAVAAYEHCRRFPAGPVLLKIIAEMGLTVADAKV